MRHLCFCALHGRTCSAEKDTSHTHYSKKELCPFSVFASHNNMQKGRAYTCCVRSVMVGGGCCGVCVAISPTSFIPSGAGNTHLPASSTTW